MRVRKNADGVVTGVVNLNQSDGTIELETRVFLPELDIWKNIHLNHDAKAGYLEQKYILLDRFGQFLDAALMDDGRWEKEALETPRQLPKLLEKADQLIEQNKLDAAAFILSEALSNEPQSAEIHHILGLVRIQQGQLEPAIEEQRNAIRLRPDFRYAYSALGDALVALKEYSEAEKVYHQLLRLEPDSAEAYFALGNVALFQGQLEEAIDQFSEALRVDPRELHTPKSIGGSL